MMDTYLIIGLLAATLANLIALLVLVRQPAKLASADLDVILAETRRAEQGIREEFGRQRDEAARAAAALRDEVAGRFATGLEGLLNRHQAAQEAIERKLGEFRSTLEDRLNAAQESSDGRLARVRQELNESAAQARTETRNGFTEFQATVRDGLKEASEAQRNQLNDFGKRLDTVNSTLAGQLDKMRAAMEGKLAELQTKNEQKLEEMRKTVDERLEGTLERRLGESFKQVSDRLEQVHKGLGEMQAMASSVGDLRRVLTNVKTRGTWGEIQLGTLLEQILAPEQFAANVAPRPGSAQRVEFAIRLPGTGEGEQPVWLPIDAKFPQEDYQRLAEASEHGDAEAVAIAGKALESRIRGQAQEIREKYIAPPHTTDFAILFLPSEGLYAEVLRRPGLADALQTRHRVAIAGPTTLAAMLNSLQMGFRTLAVQKRSSEVWTVLGSVKTEFGKFGGVLGKVKKHLEQASKQIDETETRTRAIDRRLRRVEALPSIEAAPLLDLNDAAAEPELPIEPDCRADPRVDI